MDIQKVLHVAVQHLLYVILISNKNIEFRIYTIFSVVRFWVVVPKRMREQVKGKTHRLQNQFLKMRLKFLKGLGNFFQEVSQEKNLQSSSR
jgi:hypothetical protein